MLGSTVVLCLWLPTALHALNLDQLYRHQRLPYDTPQLQQFSPWEPVYGDDAIVSELEEMLDGSAVNQKMSSNTPHPREVIGWSPEEDKLGQVTGITVDTEGRPILLHRGGRVWDQGSFNSSHHFQGGSLLDEDVVLVLDEGTGHVLSSWGRGLFLMPHGITVDAQGNTWITDVAKHQVFKFAPGSTEASLTLGKAGEPGTDDHHFCQPASVAVATSGDFFVADGYCNARVMKFSPTGELIGTFGQGSDSSSPEVPVLSVPHGLALDESRDTLCIADREHRRVICIRAGLQNNDDFQQPPLLTLQEPNQGRVFDVATINGIVVGVAGSQMEGGARGFTASLDNGELMDVWEPVEGFSNPHAITVSPDGSSIYVAEIGPNRVWKFVLELSYY
ncbi:unnamed protein product [Meganyctiphanes norvegica]|uniref:peptidylamidoglycolate lyase n=1 Tax=Meganyctiphanes norvegica TaxID=48144 RepID=A0AAV2QEE8_MEGNR